MQEFGLENLPLSILNKFSKYSFWDYYKRLKRTQWFTQKELEKLQLKKLRSILKHAYKTVPYYKQRFREVGIKPFDIKNKEDLVKIPLLTREDVLENLDRIISRDIDENKCKLTRTSGTATNFLPIIMDFDCYNRKYAHVLRANSYTGWKIGNKFAQISPRICYPTCSRIMEGNFLNVLFDILLNDGIGTNDFHQFIQERFVYPFIHRRLLLKPFENDKVNLSYEQGFSYFKKLSRYKPYLFKGYSYYLYLLAKFIEKHSLQPPEIKAIQCTMGPSTERMRNFISSVFNSKVFDVYGSRECGIIACACEEDVGLHIDAESLILEFLRNGEQSIGELANVVVTDLDNYAMPLIRYSIGNVGKKIEDNCTCGRGLPLMSSVEGRKKDIIISSDGKWITENRFFDLFYENKNIDSFKVIQVSKNKIMVYLVSKEFNNDQIKRKLIELLGSYNIKIEHVKTIDTGVCGKFRFVKKLG